MPLYPAATVVDQSQAPVDRGLKVWNYLPQIAGAGTALPTAGVLNLQRIRRVPSTSITNIVIVVTVGGGTLTAGQCFASLFTAAGALVASTADQAVAWASASVKTMSLAGGPFAVPAGDYYVGLWFNGTTGPTIARHTVASSVMIQLGLTAPDLEACTADTGLTTAAPATLGAQTANAVDFWVALS
jgi:hypothetical protein